MQTDGIKLELARAVKAGCLQIEGEIWVLNVRARAALHACCRVGVVGATLANTFFDEFEEGAPTKLRIKGHLGQKLSLLKVTNPHAKAAWVSFAELARYSITAQGDWGHCHSVVNGLRLSDQSVHERAVHHRWSGRDVSC